MSRPPRLLLLGLLAIPAAIGCTAENFGCIARESSRRINIHAYRFAAPPEELVAEAVALLERKGYHVPHPPGGRGAATVVSSWRYDDRAYNPQGPARDRITVELLGEGTGSKVRVTQEAQDLAGVRWEVIATERYSEAERALLERLGSSGTAPADGGVSAGPRDETTDLLALSAVLEARGEVLIGGLGKATPEGRPFRTLARASGPDERAWCKGFLVDGADGSLAVEVTKLRERAADVRVRASPMSYRNEEIELELIRQVDPVAGKAIHDESNRAAEEVADRAYGLGVPSCSG